MLILYTKILSLIFCSFIGFIAGRYYKVCLKTVATLIVYILAPVFNFYIMASTNIETAQLLLIPLSTIICLSIGIPALFAGRIFFKDSRANLLSLTLSVPNVGYFGIPIVIVLLGEKYLAQQLLIAVGVGLSVYTYGFYIMHRSQFSILECLKKVFTVPVLYANFFGILYSQLGFKLPALLLPTFELFKGAYSVLGLMMIGIGLGKIKGFALDIKLISLALLGKFLLYPLVTTLFLYLDSHFTQILSAEARYLFVISAIMPLGINTINFAALTEKNQAEAATLVVISTLVACVLIPFYL